MYRNHHIVTSGSTFRDIHWFNFSWCEELNPSLNKFVLVHHHNKGWMRDIHCSLESWRKVKIWKDRAGDISLEGLYHEPLAPSDSPARMAFLSFVEILYLLLILSDILVVHFNDLSSVFANKISFNFLKSELYTFPLSLKLTCGGGDLKKE